MAVNTGLARLIIGHSNPTNPYSHWTAKFSFVNVPVSPLYVAMRRLWKPITS